MPTVGKSSLNSRETTVIGLWLPYAAFVFCIWLLVTVLLGNALLPLIKNYPSSFSGTDLTNVFLLFAWIALTVSLIDSFMSKVELTHDSIAFSSLFTTKRQLLINQIKSADVLTSVGRYSTSSRIKLTPKDDNQPAMYIPLGPFSFADGRKIKEFLGIKLPVAKNSPQQDNLIPIMIAIVFFGFLAYIFLQYLMFSARHP